MRMTADVAVPPLSAGEISCVIEKAPLSPGRYSDDLWLLDGIRDLDHVEAALSFTVEPTDYYGTGVPPVSHLGNLVLDATWLTKPLG